MSVALLLVPDFILIAAGWFICRHTALNRPVWDGAERLVYGRIGGAAFTLRIEGTAPPPRPGEVIGLNVPLRHLHWFDAADGRRVG